MTGGGLVRSWPSAMSNSRPDEKVDAMTESDSLMTVRAQPESDVKAV